MEGYIDICYRVTEKELSDLFFNALEERAAQGDNEGHKQLSDGLLQMILDTEFDQKDYGYLYDHFHQTRAIIQNDSSNKPAIKGINNFSDEQWELLYQHLLFIKTTQILENPNWAIIEYCSQLSLFFLFTLKATQMLFEKDEMHLTGAEKGVLKGFEIAGVDSKVFKDFEFKNLYKQGFRGNVVMWYKLKNLYKKRGSKSDDLNYNLVIIHLLYTRIYPQLSRNWLGKVFLTGRLAGALGLTKRSKEKVELEFGDVYHPNSSLGVYSEGLVRRVRYYLEKPSKDSTSDALLEKWFPEWKEIKAEVDQLLKEI